MGGFKTLNEYQDERYKNLLTLPNDGDSVDVIFLYQSINDVMIAESVHYIKSADYTGYVFCCGKNCPACKKGIRVQGKLFIPVYDIATGQIKFWDRGIRFQNQLNQDVLSKYPNPSEAVFKITRHGVSGDMNTTYEITAIANNLPPKEGEDKNKFYKPYSEILAENHVTFPEYYNEICKDYTSAQLYNILETSSGSDGGTGGAVNSIPSYSVTPRGQSNDNQPIASDGADEDDGFMNIPEDEDDEVNF